ncbi:MAG TPA: phytanoyl-CoA dioxygenase family protein [Pirellulales bacterium]|jgi:hypothetical protein|nr:phytanoyl-CoA dioxygenase family protein [Pirellulales bacterium]
MRATEIESTGFTIIPNVLDDQIVSWLLDQLERVTYGEAVRQRGDSYFAIRNLLNAVPAIRELASSSCIRSIVDPIVGPDARVVRGIYFDKTPNANWKVAWHQDLSITVTQEKDVTGFGGWSQKAGVVHVQPPASILEQILTVRLHLDDTDESSGALTVIPGSHKHKRLSPERINELKEQIPAVTWVVRGGGAMLMRPLLVHASSASTNPSHRRVIHLEYSAAELPGGLEWHGS